MADAPPKQRPPSASTPPPAGPRLEALLHHLAETPEDFLREPKIGSAGDIDVRALVSDLLWLLTGVRPAETALRAFSEKTTSKDRNRLRISAVSCWLASHEYFRNAPPAMRGLVDYFADIVPDLAEHVVAEKFVSDQDRREELVRTLLNALQILPLGENAEEAADRLTTMSSAARKQAVEASKKAEARAKAIRDALAKRKAAESADKWTRE